MGIISKGNFKTVLGALDLSLVAKKGESLVVKNISIFSPAVVYADIKIDKTTVGCFRVNSLLGNHLQFPFGRANHAHSILSGPTAVAVMANGALRVNAGGTEMANSRLPETPINTLLVRAMNVAMGGSVGSETILKFLSKKGLFEGYPVASGQTFLVAGIAGATAVKVVEYDLYEEADIKAEDVNGSKSDTITYISYGDTGANIQIQINEVLDQSNNPPEFPDFPFGDVVPSGKKIEILGVLASDVAPAANVAANATCTEYLQMMRDQEFLFDEDRNGILCFAPYLDSVGNMNMIAEGVSVIGNYTEVDRRDPLMFDPPIVFKAGEKLTVMWHTVITGAGAVISQALQEVGFILRMSPLA